MPAAPSVRGAPDWGALVPGLPRTATGRPIVLVVTDDGALREALAAALRRQWVVVDQAADGLAALYALDQRTPNAVILDMDVSAVSGHRVYRVLRDDPETRRVAVVMVASETCQEVCARPNTMAAPEQFFQKPVTAELLLAALTQAGVLPSYARN
jgi:DNA-binding response OmpR family regulator